MSADWAQSLLRRLFGVVILLSALALLARVDLHAGFAIGWPSPWLVQVGVVAGVVVGVVGVSGGPVLAPLFALGLGMTQQLAQGSSLVLRLPAIPGGVADNQREGTVRWAPCRG